MGRKIILIALAICCCLAVSSFARAGVVTTLTVKDVAGKTTTNYPLTFGHVFKKGDVKYGVKVNINGQEVPAQVDIKRHWADGSVKHAVISVIIPKVSAYGSVKLVLETSNTATNNSGALSKEQILATDFDSIIELTNLSGSQNPASASSSLRETVSQTSNLEYWLKGDICTEILADTKLTPNDNLHARWEARFYPGTAFGIRISTIVESVNLSALGNSTYSVSLKYGHPTPAEVYHYNNYSHPYGSRWRKTFWIGQEPPEVEIHYDTGYLIATGMIPPLDTSISVPASYIDKLYSIYKTKNGEIRGGDDIDGAGSFYRAMPMVGGRDELGIIPTWQAVYLLTYNNKAREMVLGNGNIDGQIGSLHYSEGDSTKEFYMEPAVSINSRPTVRLWDLKSGIPSPVGEIPNNPNSWNPDRNHQPSAVYLPYLITGEHFYMEELSYWASYNAGYSSWARDGNGDTFKYSTYFNGLSAGIIPGETRGVAWSLRNLADAVIILPDTQNSLISYFKEKLNNNLRWLEMANIPEHQGLGFIIVAARMKLGTYPHADAPWQHDFNVIVLNDMISKQEAVNDINALVKLRDYLGSFTIGRFTHNSEFKKYDGIMYYAPVTKKNGAPFTPDSWGDYYNECKIFWEENSHHAGNCPHNGHFTSNEINDPESYLYIAKAALSGLTHLPQGNEAYLFIASNIKQDIIYRKPQWGGLISDNTTPPTYQVKPSILSISIE